MTAERCDDPIERALLAEADEHGRPALPGPTMTVKEAMRVLLGVETRRQRIIRRARQRVRRALTRG